MNTQNLNMKIRMFCDGDIVSDLTDPAHIDNIVGVAGGLNATIGSLIADPDGNQNLTLGDGKLSGSLDEFRYWKSARSAREIGLNWNTHVDGGSNIVGTTERPLSTYFKFNEILTFMNWTIDEDDLLEYPL